MTERAIVHIADTADTALCGAEIKQRDWVSDPATTGTVETCAECRRLFVPSGRVQVGMHPRRS